MSEPPRIRDATPADHAGVLALNLESEAVLSPLDLQGLQRLARSATLFRVARGDGDVAAFLLALRPGADYASPNYRWFERRWSDFLYVDRVVVAPGWRRQGLGRRLYADAFEHARALGLRRVACEFDIEPPNPASARFHAVLDFHEAGTQRVADGRKAVSLQWVEVAGPAVTRGAPPPA